MTDLDRVGNYLREKMGVVTTAGEMSVATPDGIVDFGMIGYSMSDSLLIVVSPDNVDLKESAVDRLLERMELAKRHFQLFTPNHIHGVIVCEQASDPALQYAAEKRSIAVLEINGNSIVSILPIRLQPNPFQFP